MGKKRTSSVLHFFFLDYNKKQMRNLEDRQRHTTDCGVCKMILLMFSFNCFAVGILSQLLHIRTYVQVKCLVKNSSLETCDISYTRYDSSSRCFRPMWLIKYIDYPRNVTTTINGSVFYVNGDDDSAQFYSLKKYQVFLLKCKEYSAYIKALLLLLPLPNRLTRFIRAITLLSVPQKLNGANQVSLYLIHI